MGDCQLHLPRPCLFLSLANVEVFRCWFGFLTNSFLKLFQACGFSVVLSQIVPGTYGCRYERIVVLLCSCSGYCQSGFISYVVHVSVVCGLGELVSETFGGISMNHLVHHDQTVFFSSIFKLLVAYFLVDFLVTSAFLCSTYHSEGCQLYL